MFESAITQFINYSLKFGDTAIAHLNIGKALIQLGRAKGAIDSFNTAAKLNPRDPATFFKLGLAYDLLNESRMAIEKYRQALLLDPGYAEARYTLAKTLKAGDRIIVAMAEFQKVLEQCPDHYRALNGLATCYLKQLDNNTAVKLLQRVLVLCPDFAYAQYNLGIALRNIGDAEASMRHFQAATRLDLTSALAFRLPGANGSPTRLSKEIVTSH